MADTIPAYMEKLTQALMGRKDWFENTELLNLKEALRNFQASYTSTYSILVKKKLLNEDPYKQEAKISELEVPDTGAINEVKRLEQISIRMSNFDNQLDYLANFYQLHIDYLNLEQIKRIVGLLRFIDWVNLTPDAQMPNTRIAAELVSQSKSGVDQITLSIIVENLNRLNKSTVTAMGILKDLTAYYKESYKLNVRTAITKDMSASEATAANIKKKFPSAMQKQPFYAELVEEVIREDYSKDGQDLRDGVLKTLKLAEEKPKTVKPQINFKSILLEGIRVVGNSSIAFQEIITKFDENEQVVESQKRGLWEKIKKLLRQMTGRDAEEIIYDIEYMDPTKGVPVKEKCNFGQFREDLDRKNKLLTSFVRGPAAAKIAGMTEEQIIVHLERNIKDLQSLHKTLGALDEFFKSSVPPGDRDKIKGIKPELSTIKNSIVRANQLRHEYTAQREEQEQLKRLGVSMTDN
jgi:hypothetical protein